MADVRVDVALDTSQAERDAQGLKGKLSKTFGDMGKIAGGIFMAEVGGQIASQGVATLKNSIGLARDYNEIISKSNTIFGDNAKAIEDWAETAATGFGQSKAEALDAASSFGNMFTQLGIGSETAAEMSVQMTELASDFASFHNADISEVINAQSAAFRGEYDALQRFVPTINAAAVEQKALAMTGKELTKELTAQEKALAVQALMMEGAGDAMGDFDRTSGSLSNQQRILSAQWKDIQTDIGQVLIPMLTKIAVTINTEVIPAVKKFAEDAKRNYNTDIKPVVEDLKAAWESVDQIVVPILELMGREIKRMADAVKTAVSLVANLLSGDFKGAWEDAKHLVGIAIDSIKDRITTFGSEIGPELLKIGKEAIQKLLDGIYEMVNTWLIPFFQNLPGRVVTALVGMGTALFEAGKKAIQEFVNGLKSVAIPSPKDLAGNSGWSIPGLGLPAAAAEGVVGLIEGQVAGGGGGGGPTGAYNQPLVRDPQTGAMVYSWDVGQGYGNAGRFNSAGQVMVSIQNYNAGTADGDLAAGDLLYALGSKGLA